MFRKHSHMKSYKTIVWIPGLNSSNRSFNYIIACLPAHNAIKVDYDSHQPLQKSITQVLKQIPSDGEISIVGHSLGGVIGTLLSADDRVQELVTISSPLGGSKAANFVRWLPGHPEVLHDITPRSPYIQHILMTPLSVPTLSIISTAGHLNTTSEPNDSVVTVASQIALPFGKKTRVQASHFEILLADETVKLIKKHIFGDL